MSGKPQVLSIRESREKLQVVAVRERRREKVEEIVLRMIVSRLRGIELELSQIANTLTMMNYQSVSEDLVRAIENVRKVIKYLDDYADILTLS